MSTSTRLLVLTAALGLMAGCASGPMANSPIPTLATYMKYSGPPINSFTYLGRYTGFRPLGGKYLVIRTSINDAYLIKVLEPCVNLPFASKVALSSESNTVTRGVDWVTVEHDHCHIDTVRRVDYGAMKSAGLAPP